MGDRFRRILVSCGLAWVGAVAGLFLGAWRLPPGQGLAGPAIVLGHGVIGLAIGLAGGALLGWWVPPRAVRPVFRTVVALGLIALVAVVIQVVGARRERALREARDEARRRAPFTASAITHQPSDGATFIEIEVDGHGDTFLMLARKRPDRPRCRGEFGERRRVRMLRVLRAAETLLARDPEPCAGHDDEPTRTFRWSLPEAGGIEREVRLSRTCERAHPELSALFGPFESIAFSASHVEGGLVCEP